MPNRVNELQVAQYKKAFGDAGFVIAVGYPKLNVQGVNELRGKLAAAGCRLLFVRNRLVAIAMRELGRGDVLPLCDGQTAFVWGGDPVSTARFLVDFKKEHAELLLHGALLERELLDSKRIVELSTSPTREELKSIISGQILAVGGKLSAQFLAGGGKVASQIKRIAGEEGGAAA